MVDIIKEQVWLSLGGNIGDKKAFLTFAVSELAKNPQVEIGCKSSIYLTSAWGREDQDDFYNAVVEVFTTLSPWEFLTFCQDIEKAAGRKRIVHWGPRELDIDILLFGGHKMETGDLRIPHPYIGERAFVLVPLLEIDPEMELANLGKLKLIASGCDKSGVKKLYGPEEW